MIRSNDACMYIPCNRQISHWWQSRDHVDSSLARVCSLGWRSFEIPSKGGRPTSTECDGHVKVRSVSGTEANLRPPHCTCPFIVIISVPQGSDSSILETVQAKQRCNIETSRCNLVVSKFGNPDRWYRVTIVETLRKPYLRLALRAELVSCLAYRFCSPRSPWCQRRLLTHRLAPA